VPYARHRLRAAGEAGLVAAGMVAFALLSAAGTGRGWAAGAGLVLAGLAHYLSMRTGTHPIPLFALVRPRGWAWALVGGGAILGAALAVLYRWAWMPTVWPPDFRGFVFVAMLIGAAEETLYRGYVQGRLGVALVGRKRVQESFSVQRRPPHGRRLRKKTPGPFSRLALAILLAAGAHTAYKTALFVRPPAGIEVDYGFLVLWTLVGGVAFGALRAWAGSVCPAVAAHVAFDLVAYGDAAEAAWWVWM